MKKGGFMKDALILFAITLISGTLLGAVYSVTKDPIEKASMAASLATY
ncbi:MAG: electron transporter RnfG, partial [Hungatella sp.]